MSTMLSSPSWRKLLNESSSSVTRTTVQPKVWDTSPAGGHKKKHYHGTRRPAYEFKITWNLFLGPIINEGGIQKVIEHIEDAVKRGATIVTGGKRLNGFTRYIEPTILTNVPRDALALNDETFGPRKFVHI